MVVNSRLIGFIGSVVHWLSQEIKHWFRCIFFIFSKYSDTISTIFNVGHMSKFLPGCEFMILLLRMLCLVFNWKKMQLSWLKKVIKSKKCVFSHDFFLFYLKIKKKSHPYIFHYSIFFVVFFLRNEHLLVTYSKSGS